MIIDKQMQLSSAQAITSTAASTNYIDTGAAGEPGQADRGQVLAVTVDTTFTAGGAGTLQIQVQCDDNSSFSSPKTVIETDALALASLVAAQDPIYIKLPYGLNERYVRLNYVVATGPMTAGALTAQLVDAPQASHAYHASSQV